MLTSVHVHFHVLSPSRSPFHDHTCQWFSAACPTSQKAIVLLLNSSVRLKPAWRIVGRIVALRSTSMQNTEIIKWQELLHLQPLSMTKVTCYSLRTILVPVICKCTLGIHLAPTPLSTTAALASTLQTHLFQPCSQIRQFKEVRPQIQILLVQSIIHS